MSYPQTQKASQEILEGQNFFRLATQLVSSGDAYEMDASAHAFVIGPQSDIARARVTYYDPSSPTKSSSFVVSVDSPFLGRIDRFGSQKYPGGNMPANIIITPEDIINNEWLPATADPADHVISFVKPNIDLLGYFSDPPTTPARRADYTKKGALYVRDDGSGTDGNTYFILPFYRRKYASLKFRNGTPGAYSLDVDGVAFTTVDGSGLSSAVTDDLITMGAVAIGSSAFEIRASTMGLWDYLAVRLFGPIIAPGAANAVYYDFTFTDEET